MSGVVVVGVDGSEGSLRALRWAFEEAALRGARLRAVHAWSYVDQPGDEFDPQYSEDDARRELDEALASVELGAPGAPEVERHVICDLPAPAILDALGDADLVVVGSRGHGAVKGAVLGSVSTDIVHRAPCPVVVVPGRERAEQD